MGFGAIVNRRAPSLAAMSLISILANGASGVLARRHETRSCPVTISAEEIRARPKAIAFEDRRLYRKIIQSGLLAYLSERELDARGVDVHL